MITRREYAHDVAPREKQGYRQDAAAERLAQNQAVRVHVLVFTRQQFPGPAEAGLYLIGNQQDVMLAAQLGCSSEITLRRNDDTALSLDRLHQESRRIVVDRRFERRNIAIVDEPESGRERAEPLLILGLIGHRDDRDRAAVEVVLAGDDLGLVLRDALDRVGPLAGGLDRGLDRLGTGVHRQRHVLAGQRAGALEKRPELVRIERA